jgi:hypothetical protein
MVNCFRYNATAFISAFAAHSKVPCQSSARSRLKVRQLAGTDYGFALTAMTLATATGTERRTLHSAG